ncbi:hypothetical protein [Tessaracoccus rhinocerotis]|nr:hypothetical protein [Tessaracoccus rhinocerotis]
MTEQPNTEETQRTHSEEPAEGAVDPGDETPEREHPQAPAEGRDAAE